MKHRAKAGALLTGTEWEAVTTHLEAVTTVAATGATETLDASAASVYDLTLDQACTFTLTGATDDEAAFLTVILRGAFGTTWPAEVTWLNGAPPASSLRIVTLFTVDGGTNWYGSATSGLNSGTAFPSAPSTGELFHRTDDRLTYQYDGTRWLCTCLHDMALTTRVAVGGGYSADQVIGMAPTRGSAGDVFVEDLIVMAFANSGAFDASNRWVVRLSTRDASNTNTDIGSVTMNSQTSNTWKEWTDEVDVVVDGSTELVFNLEADETGTPGTLIAAARITFRHIGA